MPSAIPYTSTTVDAPHILRITAKKCNSLALFQAVFKKRRTTHVVADTPPAAF
jgi:hypothetical protein